MSFCSLSYWFFYFSYHWYQEDRKTWEQRKNDVIHFQNQPLNRIISSSILWYNENENENENYIKVTDLIERMCQICCIIMILYSVTDTIEKIFELRKVAAERRKKKEEEEEENTATTTRTTTTTTTTIKEKHVGPRNPSSASDNAERSIEIITHHFFTLYLVMAGYKYSFNVMEVLLIELTTLLLVVMRQEGFKKLKVLFPFVWIGLRIGYFPVAIYRVYLDPEIEFGNKIRFLFSLTILSAFNLKWTLESISKELKKAGSACYPAGILFTIPVLVLTCNSYDFESNQYIDTYYEKTRGYFWAAYILSLVAGTYDALTLKKIKGINYLRLFMDGIIFSSLFTYRLAVHICDMPNPPQFDPFQCGIGNIDDKLTIHKRQTMKMMFSFIKNDFPEVCNSAQLAMSRNPLVTLIEYLNQINISNTLPASILSTIVFYLQNINFVAIEVIVYTIIIYSYVYAIYTHLRSFIMQRDNKEQKNEHKDEDLSLKTNNINGTTRISLTN